MSTGSSGCVLNNLFTCEKKCNSVASRKALLEDFTSKIYDAEVVYVDNDGKTTEDNYRISFQLSENQKDSEMIRVHGFAILQKEEETPIKCSWSAIYLEKKHGYKMKLSGDNIEKDFYVYCHGNDKINFLIKKTVPEDLTVHGSKGPRLQGAGNMLGSSNNCYDTCTYRCLGLPDAEFYVQCLGGCGSQCNT